MKQVCRELISFFENEEGWDKGELLQEYVEEIFKKHGIENCGSVISPDEVEVVWDGSARFPMTAKDFAIELFDKIISGVCNVIRTA